MKIQTGLMVVLSLVLNSSPALAEPEAPAAVSCDELRQSLGIEYIERSAVLSTEAATLKKLYATAEAPLKRVKQHLKPEFFGEIERARIENRLVDGRFAEVVAKVSKELTRTEACARGYQVRIGDEHEFSAFNDLTYCVQKDNAYNSSLPRQNNLKLTQGRIAIDTSSPLGKTQLTQEGCPGREDCFLKVRSFALAKAYNGEPRDIELNLDLASANLDVSPSLDKLMHRLDPADVLNRTSEEYVTAMLRDKLGRTDCVKTQTYEAKE
jgi:hypothetical protein